MVAVRIHCVGYRYIAIAIICYCSNGVGIVFFDSIDELAFVKCYGVVMVAVRIHCIGYSYVSVAIICYHSNSVGIVFFDSIDELAFIKTYGIFVVTVCINSFSNIYITIAIILRGGNGIGIVCLNSFDELAFVKCYGIVMVAVCIHSVGYSDITHAIIRYGSNGISVLSIFLNKALQSIFINTDYIILIIQIATAHAVIYSNDSMTGFCSSNSIGIICLNSFNELIFINSYGIIVVTVCINSFGNIHITFAVCLCGSNGVSIILLYKIAQLRAVDINLISMITFYAFICNFQHIGCGLYGSNGISINNTLHLLVYPAAGSNTFYLSLYAVLVGIINLYRQRAIFIQASFHAGISGISINNTLHLLVYPALNPALRSNTVYAVGVNSAGIISNIGSQRAVCKGQFIGCNLGIGINNGCSKYLIIRSYQLIGIDCLALTGSRPYLFNNLILQACLTCFTVNGLCHGDIIGIERFDNSVKFAYSNSAHGLFALHFGIVALMYRTPAISTLFPLIIMSMINKRCKQFNLLAGANLYLCMS